MTARERVLAALRREQPDRTPRDFWAEPPAMKRLFDYVGHSDKDRLLESLGVDVRHLEAPAPPDRVVGQRVMQNLLPGATPAQVEAEVRRYCEALGAGGGYILGPAHLFQVDVPPENVLAVYRGAW